MNKRKSAVQYFACLVLVAIHLGCVLFYSSFSQPCQISMWAYSDVCCRFLEHFFLGLFCFGSGGVGLASPGRSCLCVEKIVYTFCGSFYDCDSLACGVGVRGWPFDFWWGGCAHPQKNIVQMFLVKKKFLAEFLRRKKKSSSLINLGVAKDFAWCVTAPKIAVSHMIQDWASHFLMRELVFCKRDAWFTN